MKFKKWLRGCDIFGVPISLKLSGSSSYDTIGGGLASFCLKVLIIAYFCLQTIHVFSYEDPQISSFSVLDSR